MASNDINALRTLLWVYRWLLFQRTQQNQKVERKTVFIKEKKSLFAWIFDITITFNLFLITILIYCILFKIHPIILLQRLDSLTYGDAKLYWQRNHPLPEENLEVFYQVVESLTNDVKEEYSITNNSMRVYYVERDKTYVRICNEDSLACYHPPTDSIYISRGLIENRDVGFYAMVLVHEYVHVIQFAHTEYLNQYALDTGWVENGNSFSQPEHDRNFFMVLSQGSLQSPFEDMANTFMFSYLCGNNLEALSETRRQYIEGFWDISREQYCQNLP